MKKKLFSRVLSLVLVCTMMLAMAACGQEKKPTEESKSSEVSQATQSSEVKETESVEEEREAVELIFYTNLDPQTGTEAMIKALNEYLAEKLNTTLDIRFEADFSTKVPTMIDAGGDWDIVLTGLGLNFDTYAARNAFAPITDYVDEYLPLTTGQLVENAYASFTMNGEVYGVPVLKDMFSREGWTINQSMLDDLGVKFPENYATNWDVVDFLYEVKAARDAKYPDKANNPILKNAMHNYDQWYVHETLVGGWNKPLVATNISEEYGYEGIELETTAFCPIYTEEYREVMKQVRALVKDGIGAFDSKNFDPDKVLHNAGDLLGSVGSGNIYVSEDANAPYYKTSFYPSSISYAADYTYGFAINADCEHVERALEVLEVIQNDTYAATTLHFGPEGDGWTDADNDGVIELGAKNTDPSNRYHYRWYGWQLGGVTALKPIPGSPADLMDQMKELNKTAEPKPNRGFKFDKTPVENEMAAINNVFAEYHPLLQSGQNDNVDELVDEFIAKLKANGMDKIVEECQNQLDTWRAANGK